MTNITLDRSWSGGDIESARVKFTRHLLVFARARRFARIRGARMRLIQSEMRDPRWYADIGLDFEKHSRRDWIVEMVRAMGVRL